MPDEIGGIVVLIAIVQLPWPGDGLKVHASTAPGSAFAPSPGSAFAPSFGRIGLCKRDVPDSGAAVDDAGVEGRKDEVVPLHAAITDAAASTVRRPRSRTVIQSLPSRWSCQLAAAKRSLPILSP